MDEPERDPIPASPATPLAQGVRALEQEAARLLEQARAEGVEILQASRREVEALAAADVPTEGVEAECAARIAAARDDARERVTRAEVDAAALRKRAQEKIDALASQIVGIVSGARL